MSNIIRWIRKVRHGKKESSLGLPPAMTAEPSSNTFPRAIHISERDKLPQPGPRGADYQVLLIIVANAQGATDGRGLCRLLEKEMKWGEFDEALGIEEDGTRFYCDDYPYDVHVVSSDFMKIYGRDCVRAKHHFGLILTYDASSRNSWDEMAAIYENLCANCETGAIPCPVLVAAMGEGLELREEAEAFSNQRACRFVQYSPLAKRGVRDAFASLVELAHGTRMRYAEDPGSFQLVIDSTAKAIQGLFRPASVLE